MNTTRTAAALLLSFLISIISVSSGFPQSPPPSGNATVEGTWLITYEQQGLITLGSKEKGPLVGERLTIRFKSPGEYEVIWQNGKTQIYVGSPTEIAYVLTHTFEDLKKSMKRVPDAALRGLVGVQTKDYLRLSPDGRTLLFLQEVIKVTYNTQTGQLGSYRITPPQGPSTILTRVVEPVAPSKAAPAPAPTTLPPPAAAKKTATSPVAQVESRGEFYFLTKDGRKLTGAEANKVPLEEGGKVVTGKGGHVRLTLPDATTFTVGANSEIVIDKFVYDPDQSPKKVMVGMTKGMFRWVTGKVAAARKELAELKIDLPPLVGGIRGTDFEAAVDPKGRGRVALYSGELEITEKKSEYTFILKAGQMVTFGPDGKVSRPKKIKGAQMVEDEEEG